MHVSYRGSALLCIVFVICLLSYFNGISSDNNTLSDSAVPFLWIFGGLFVAFLVVTLIQSFFKTDEKEKEKS